MGEEWEIYLQNIKRLKVTEVAFRQLFERLYRAYPRELQIVLPFNEGVRSTYWGNALVWIHDFNKKQAIMKALLHWFCVVLYENYNVSSLSILWKLHASFSLLVLRVTVKLLPLLLIRDHSLHWPNYHKEYSQQWQDRILCLRQNNIAQCAMETNTPRSLVVDQGQSLKLPCRL